MITSGHASSMRNNTEDHTLKREVAPFETQVTAARARQNHSPPPSAPNSHPAFPPNNYGLLSYPILLLFLSDSALPLGSYAFCSGLESYLAHHHPSSSSSSSPTNSTAASSLAFSHLLTLALTTLATTTLPYLLAAHRSPARLQILDAMLDACALCPVARRVSVAQGMALLTLWERALRTTAAAVGGEDEDEDEEE